jgi:hypothetical protein
MMVDVSSELSGLSRLLLAGRNPDGGWGYYRGKSSRLEPTCWALLALAGRPDVPDPGGVLRNWPASGGLLSDGPGPPNYGFHGIGLLALHALGIEHAGGNAALVESLQHARGTALGPSTINRQDNSLQAWSWTPDTFSWVEPTAWCLLALKQFSRTRKSLVDPARVAEGEAVLVDRCSPLGGWNYGNSNMLGKELHPYVSTTAIALLALQDRTDLGAVRRSGDFLERNMLTERSGLALSLSLLALRTLGRPHEGLRTAMKGQVATTLMLGNHLNVALSLYALRTDHHDAALRI